MPKQEGGGDRFLPAIRRARVGELNIYEVTDQELDQLEHGASHTLLLNRGVLSVGIGASFLASFLTGSFS